MAAGVERRSKRTLRPVDYRQLADIALPRAPKKVCSEPSSELYPVRIVEQTESRALVHYVGYSSSYDEWKEYCELEELDATSEAEEHGATIHTPLQPYSLYKDLSIKIKQAMVCGRKTAPSVRISMSFDIIQFNGGLKLVGVPSRRAGGNQYYMIKHYRDLNPFLGSNWHYRGLNANGDYGYAVMETVEFSVRKSKALVEYYPLVCGESSVSHSSLDTGYTLSFCFLCGYGNVNTFGKDRKIFYE